MSQGPIHPGSIQEKVQKGDFQKKGLMRSEIFLFVFGSYECLEGLEF